MDVAHPPSQGLPLGLPLPWMTTQRSARQPISCSTGGNWCNAPPRAHVIFTSHDPQQAKTGPNPDIGTPTPPALCGRTENEANPFKHNFFLIRSEWAISRIYSEDRNRTQQFRGFSRHEGGSGIKGDKMPQQTLALRTEQAQREMHLLNHRQVMPGLRQI